ncbi:MULTISPECIES: DUF2934 domain-containing protein [Sorangium]|uniref:DUF2934 domain-containing protein n=1 Tax=Sorangium cellulosum TaxID=56 RepID=A0A4P2QZQ2_SORCE|nr:MULTISPECIES: DUF2934 domain-containing protein [Sorangium]AUX36110.1 hypothetical protein SOCE836_083160 [Sorangium cellulosum]WCQ95414.1 hypothetical protein NQZ70_08190 [Sorangium sp. Soce836]
MSSKRKTPARTKTTKVPSPLAAPAAATRPASAVSAPAAVERPSPAVEQLAAERARVEAPKAAPPPPRPSREERHRLIAKVAYGYAERAGFRNNPVEDWLNAEREVDARLERLAS